MISKEYLEANASKSIQQRVNEINLEWDLIKPITLYDLRKLYYTHKIKKKKLIKSPGNPKKYT